MEDFESVHKTCFRTHGDKIPITRELECGLCDIFKKSEKGAFAF